VSHLDESFLNTERERQRLAANYAGMTDGELQRLARNAESLTELAWDALEDEMDRRHLEVSDDAPEPRQEMEVRELVTIRQFRDLPEALLAKGSLESAGIQAYLVDDNMIRMDWFISNLLGGVKLKVQPEDADVANEILNQPIPETLDVEGVGNFEQPKCPRCQSLDVGLPIPVQKHGWTCHACGNEWEDESSAPPQL